MRKQVQYGSQAEYDVLIETPGYGVLRQLFYDKRHEELKVAVLQRQDALVHEDGTPKSARELIVEESVNKNPLVPKHEPGGAGAIAIVPNTAFMTAQQITVADIVRTYYSNHQITTLFSESDETKEIISLKSNLTVSQALDFLAEKHITGGPVIGKDGSFLGAATTTSLMYAILSEPRPSILREYLDTYTSIYDTKLHNLSNESKKLGLRDIVAIPGTSTLLELADLFTKKKLVHRAFVTDAAGIKKHIVSQSKLIAHLAKNYDAIFKKFKIKVVHLQAIIPQIWCVKDSAKTGSALASILHHKISGVCVLDKNQKLVGELSGKSLKQLRKQDTHLLSYSVKEFLEKKPPQHRPATCGPGVRLDELLEIFASTGAHRVWVLSSRASFPRHVWKKRVLGVITLTSLLRALLGYAPEHLDQIAVMSKKDLAHVHDVVQESS